MHYKYLIYFRYMMVKTQEKKTSQREAQLERKVASLEEELHKTKTQLDREYLIHEAKKAKVHHRILYIVLYYYFILLCLIHFFFNTDCGGTFIMGKTKEMATDSRKVKRKIERKD